MCSGCCDVRLALVLDGVSASALCRPRVGRHKATKTANPQVDARTLMPSTLDGVRDGTRPTGAAGLMPSAAPVPRGGVDGVSNHPGRRSGLNRRNHEQGQ